MMCICSRLFADGQRWVEGFSLYASTDMVDHLLLPETNDDFVSKLNDVTYPLGGVFG